MAPETKRARSPEAELQLARTIIAIGLVIWVLLAVAVQVRWGALTAFVLVGWGGSMLVCLAFVVAPLLHSPLPAAVDGAGTSVGERPVAA